MSMKISTEQNAIMLYKIQFHDNTHYAALKVLKVCLINGCFSDVFCNYFDLMVKPSTCINCILRILEQSQCNIILIHFMVHITNL